MKDLLDGRSDWSKLLELGDVVEELEFRILLREGRLIIKECGIGIALLMESNG
jgi:hypothetical protein